jgi:hypothetical protein
VRDVAKAEHRRKGEGRSLQLISNLSGRPTELQIQMVASPPQPKFVLTCCRSFHSSHSSRLAFSVRDVEVTLCGLKVGMSE